MMRRYHRWLAILFGVFILWIAATGTIVQMSRLLNPEHEEAEGRAPPPPAAAAQAPARDDADEQRGPDAARDPARQFIHFVTELHSGEEFGLPGQIVGLVSGLALLFFAVSGLTMYIQLFRGRLVKVGKGGQVRGGKWFWR